MSSQDLLVRYFANGLLTNTLSLEEFVKVVKNANRHISRADMESWYYQYKQRDDSTVESLKGGVGEFLRKTRESKVRELEIGQLSESFTLEEIINNIYTVDQVLDRRLKTINKSLGSNAEELNNFNEILRHSSGSKDTLSDGYIGDLLETLKKYKSFVEDSEIADSQQRT